MFTQKCPGQDMRYWTADDVHEEKCPRCGEIIEFFKTDIRLRCRSCKTRVANPRFDMGCAEWCAHAEMCLGPGAKGIQKKSFRTVLEEEFERMSAQRPENIKVMKDLINSAEDKCRRENSDMLPVVAAAVILALLQLGLIENVNGYINQLAEEHEFPGAVVDETRALVENIKAAGILKNSGPGKIAVKPEGSREKIVAELFQEYGSKFVKPEH